MQITVTTPTKSFNFNTMLEALNYINSNNISNFKLVRK